MKITSGLYRGRELTSPKTNHTHPMGSRERLALFNSLSPYLPDAVVLDAYAGTGALGLEAFSRGAKTVTFIENHPAALKALRQNLAKLNLTADIMSCAVSQAPLAQYDLILADPPYEVLDPASPQYQSTLQELAHLVQALTSGGHFVLSHPANFNHKDFAESNHLKQISAKSYAAANISIFTPLPIA